MSVLFLDVRRVEFADFANFSGSIQLHASVARLHDRRPALAAVPFRGEEKSAHELAIGDHPGARGALGDYGEHQRSDRSLSGSDGGAWLPGRHRRELAGRYGVLWSGPADCAQARLVAIATDIHCHRDRFAVLDSR